jgi:undecaprenyl-phosphate galactose phosphotransferase
MYNFLKRIFDLILSLIGLVFLIPLYLIIRLLYIFTGDLHRIIFVQTRVGKDGKPFQLLKFRTMNINADQELKTILNEPKYRKEWDKFHKISNDPRITKVGHFLRRASLDEFPQFINIFLGSLSVIGPRPLVPGELEEHHGNTKLYWSIKPGLTGWWAVNGRSLKNYEERLKLEYYYINHRSISLDAKIIFKTFTTILKKSGAK